MKLPSGQLTHRRSRLLPFTVGLSLVAVSGAAVSACSSSGASQGSDQAIQQVCQSVGAVLSDGPDPDDDPVGYAEAQVMPLEGIHTSDEHLQTAIDGLASAYALFFRTKGAADAKTAVARANNQLNAICPGVAS
jgi:hypothetical protein